MDESDAYGMGRDGLDLGWPVKAASCIKRMKKGGGLLASTDTDSVASMNESYPNILNTRSD